MIRTEHGRPCRRRSEERQRWHEVPRPAEGGAAAEPLPAEAGAAGERRPGDIGGVHGASAQAELDESGAGEVQVDVGPVDCGGRLEVGVEDALRGEAHLVLFEGVGLVGCVGGGGVASAGGLIAAGRLALCGGGVGLGRRGVGHAQVGADDVDDGHADHP